MKLLVVDDHSVVREGLAALLLTFGKDTKVFGAEDGPQAIAIAEKESDLDVVILDLAMPGMNGMKVLEELSSRRPGLPVMVLSASEEADYVRQTMAKGALGYVPKSASPDTLIAAIKFVLQGEIYVPPFMLNASGASSSSTAGKGLPRLTKRQEEVLAALCKGLSNKGIARDLNMSEKTVKAHITTIFRLLGVQNRTQAVNLARSGSAEA
jgi:two-component system, NarL family, nitrate/nitrite response regulator NarL